MPTSPKAPRYADFLPRALNSGFWEQPFGPRDQCSQDISNAGSNATGTNMAADPTNANATIVADRRSSPLDVEVACSNDVVDAVFAGDMRIATGMKGLASSLNSVCMDIDVSMSNLDV